MVPYQFPEKLIPLLIRNGLNNLELPIYGDGKQIRDWLYVEDNCRGILSVLEKGRDRRVFTISAPGRNGRILKSSEAYASPWLNGRGQSDKKLSGTNSLRHRSSGTRSSLCHQHIKSSQRARLETAIWSLPLESSKPSIGISIISIGFRGSLRVSIAIITIRSTGTLGMQSRQLADRSWQRSSVVTNGLLTAQAPCLLLTATC